MRYIIMTLCLLVSSSVWADDSALDKISQWVTSALGAAPSIDSLGNSFFTSFGKASDGQPCGIFITQENPVIYVGLGLGPTVTAGGSLADAKFISGYLEQGVDLQVSDTEIKFHSVDDEYPLGQDPKTGEFITAQDLGRTLTITLDDQKRITRVIGTMSVDPKSIDCVIQN